MLKNEIVHLNYVVGGKRRGGKANIVISQVKFMFEKLKHVLML